MPNELEPSEISELYRSELRENVLPFWMRHSMDAEHGGTFSCLDRDGSVWDTKKYVWMMARQVWMLRCLGEGLAVAEAGMSFLDRHAVREDGQVWFSLTREGMGAYCQRKPYSAVFLALALQASGRGEEARRWFGRVRHWIRHPEELGRPASAMSQLADIYVTAFLARELGEPEHFADCFARLDAHFDGDVLRENASVSRATPEGRLFCPGSVFEIAWILLPHAPDPLRLLRAVEKAHALGWDREEGGYFYFLDLEGRPPAQLEWNMKLWWVHVEALVAFAHAWELTGERRWLDRFRQVHEYVWPRFRDPEYGEWFGYLDRGGRPTHLMKGGPYKCCFHVPRALWLISEIFSKKRGV